MSNVWVRGGQSITDPIKERKETSGAFEYVSSVGFFASRCRLRRSEGDIVTEQIHAEAGNLDEWVRHGCEEECSFIGSGIVGKTCQPDFIALSAAL
jgi:hypothetical protein